MKFLNYNEFLSKSISLEREPATFLDSRKALSLILSSPEIYATVYQTIPMICIVGPNVESHSFIPISTQVRSLTFITEKIPIIQRVPLNDLGLYLGFEHLSTTIALMHNPGTRDISFRMGILKTDNPQIVVAESYSPTAFKYERHDIYELKGLHNPSMKLETGVKYRLTTQEEETEFTIPPAMEILHACGSQ